MPRNDERCAACLEMEEIEAFEETPFWKSRETALIGASALLLIAGLALDLALGEKTLALLFFLAAAFLSGHRIIAHGTSSLLKGHFTIDLLMTAASIGAFLIGQPGEGALVLFLFSIAEFLEDHASDRAKRSLHNLLKLAPQTATVKRDGKEQKAHVHDIAIGETVVVRPGEKIPLDGVVIKGSSDVNQASITGESIPVYKEVDSKVYGGTLNHDGYLEIKVSKDSEHSLISRIIQLVSEAQRQKSASERFIDRFSRYYTPTVITLAVIVAVIPPFLFGQPLETWVYRALVLMVISCPCALAISTTRLVSAVWPDSRSLMARS